ARRERNGGRARARLGADAEANRRAVSSAEGRGRHRRDRAPVLAGARKPCRGKVRGGAEGYGPCRERIKHGVEFRARLRPTGAGRSTATGGSNEHGEESRRSDSGSRKPGEALVE